MTTRQPSAQGITPAPFIDIIRTVFPVVSMAPESDQAARPDFFGSAFCVAPGIFMTAAHVIREAEAVGAVAVGGPVGDGLLGAARAKQTETWPDRDIGLIYCGVQDIPPLNIWMIHRVQLLTDLQAFGYPHAVTWSPAGDKLHVVFRGYKGYVITTRGFERLPGSPSVYEVSSPYPVGMSGAPVLFSKDDGIAVAGVVVGTDTVTYAGVPQNVGIAMTAEEIVGLRSDILGGPIAEMLGFAGAILSNNR